MSKIEFRIVPFDGEDEVLIKDNNSFICFELMGLDYESFIEKKLQSLFHLKFSVARSFLVLNSDEKESKLIIYTIVIPEKGFVPAGFIWKPLSDVSAEDFDEYDEVAVNALKDLI